MIADIHNEINELRQLEHYISSIEFRQFYDSLRNTIEIDYQIKARNLEAVKRYVRHHQPLEEYSVKELRRIAAGLRLQDYHLLTKNQLIEGIKVCRATEQTLQQSKNYMNV